MKLSRWLIILTVMVVGAGVAHASPTGVSYVGTLATPQSAFEVTVDLSASSTITLQTYGFGGGVNQAGTTISPGGTDPFVAIFSGAGPGATILTDGSSNPFGTSLDLTNYDNPGDLTDGEDFVGCGPAGAPVIGGSAQCGDITMTLPSLAAGVYTVVLSDGNYVAGAVYDNGTLGEGFSDLTAGGFCNLLINGVNCPNTSGAYALDITGLPPGSTVSVTPEPASLVLWITGLAGVGWRVRPRVRRRAARS
jgi:hypothetical protein